MFQSINFHSLIYFLSAVSVDNFLFIKIINGLELKSILNIK